MSYLDVSNGYPVSAQASDIPNSIMSSQEPKPIPSSTRLISVPSSSGAQSASGSIRIQVPTGGNTFLKNGSAYLKAKITVTTSAGAGNCFFGNATKSASSIIRMLTLSIGNQVVEQINDYGLHTAPALLLHGASYGFYNLDSRVMEYTEGTITTPAGLSVSLNVCIPLCLGLLQNSNRSLPLCIMTAPLMLQVDLYPVAQAFTSGTATPTSYTVDDVNFVYESISVDDSYVQALKAQMSAGQLFQIPFTQFQGISVANSASLYYNIGLNQSSVKAVLLSLITNANNVVANQKFLSEDDFTQMDLLKDGMLINSFPLRTTDLASQVYAELQRTLGVLGDATITSSSPDTTFSNYYSVSSAGVCAGDYTTKYFVAGYNLTRFSNEGLSMNGQPCQQLSVRLSGAGTAGTLYFTVISDAILTIDVNGVVQKII